MFLGTNRNTAEAESQGGVSETIVKKGYLDALHPSADLATTYSPAS
jgi:hypothetical protein